MVISGFPLNVVVTNVMMNLYAKFEIRRKVCKLLDKMEDRITISRNAKKARYVQNLSLKEAKNPCRELQRKDKIAWDAMIAGCSQNGIPDKVLQTFEQMQPSGVKLNTTTLANIRLPCAIKGALGEDMDIQQRVVENCFASNDVVVNDLAATYAKCGGIQEAQESFGKMYDVDTASCTTNIGGHEIHGYSGDTLNFFDLTKHLGTNFDSISIECVLFVCSYIGLTDGDLKYLTSMDDSYCIIPGMDHYVRNVGFFSYADFIEEALNFIVKVSLRPELCVWIRVLGSCISHKNAGIGGFVATIFFRFKAAYAPTSVLLSNNYADVCSWDDFQRVRILMKDKEIRKAADNKMRGWILWGYNNDVVADLFDEAANSYRLAKGWDKVGSTYIKCAQFYLKLKSKHEAATTYVSAENCYKKINSQDVFRYLNLAVNLFMKIGRLSATAKHYKNMGEIYRN